MNETGKPLIIDCHTHIYPDKIAQKAADAIGNFYGIPMSMDGSLGTLLSAMDRSGVDKCLVCSAAVDAVHVRPVNDYIISAVKAHPDRLMGFGTLHPDLENPGQELDYMLKNGLLGVKLHPDMQKFALEESRTEKLYAVCEGVCPMLLHTGDKRYHYSNPTQIPPILKKYPRLVLECAHLGGYSEWDDAVRCLIDTNVYVDCSSSFFAMDDEKARELIMAYGEDRVLFGSDYPMWDMQKERARLEGLELPPEMMKKIYAGNILKMLNIKQ